ncbi:RNA polymerase sigma-70 factor [Mucilaginibacter terrigena]|uniref:RNA polymerase sigma-70 factor n=1 Tax=Mucilaginibacter terrigena TaxID=2492395 RepID=A0A4Q5LRS7_9SPHI|nr:RNA polymerase sigma-70 factor [Mucilaginibacter terrigena]RYU92164.1 RNA polymerase sigma-70 factor [Mucilaginibacter terrigena]
MAYPGLSVYQKYTDQELFDLLQSGDQVAYTTIYERYIFTLLNHAFNKTRNREEARDIVQEVFTRLWARRQQIQITTNLAGFLYTSVHHIIIDQFVHSKVKDKYFASILAFAAQSHEATDHRTRENQLAAIIEKEIAGLPPKMREIFELSRKHHLSHKEIAERLNIAEQTVSKQVSNALKILRFKLGIIAYLYFIIWHK